MPYSKKLIHSDDTLKMLVGRVFAFNEGNFLDAISRKNMSMLEIKVLLNNVNNWTNQMSSEVLLLNEFVDGYNKKYPTDEKTRLTTADKLFNQMRHGIKEAAQIYGQFCPRVRKDFQRLPWKVERIPTVFERSYLSVEYYMGDIFGMDSYPEIVFYLYQALDRANKTFIVGIMLCRQALRKEHDLSESPIELEALYLKCLDEAVQSQQSFIDYILDNEMEPPKSELTDELKKAKNADERHLLLKKFFHNCTSKDFGNHAVAEYIFRIREDSVESYAKTNWPYNYEKGLQVIWVIQHMDDLDPKGSLNRKKDGPKYSLDGEFLALLLKWSQYGGTEKDFIEKVVPKWYKGQYSLVASNTVNTASGKLVKSGDIGEEKQQEFDYKVEQFLRNSQNSGKFFA